MYIGVRKISNVSLGFSQRTIILVSSFPNAFKIFRIVQIYDALLATEYDKSFVFADPVQTSDRGFKCRCAKQSMKSSYR